MINLKNADRLALHMVANFNCGDSKCIDCPYYYPNLDEYTSCISVYLKQIADKYYTERTDK